MYDHKAYEEMLRAEESERKRIESVKGHADSARRLDGYKGRQ